MVEMLLPLLITTEERIKTVMRKYTITVLMPDDYIELNQTPAMDLDCIKNGELPVDELVDWGQNNPDFSIEYKVEDI